MDNPSSHKRPRVTGLIESVGAELRFLSPYSPELNPIEMVLWKIKQKLRDLACRIRDTLWRSIQPVLDSVIGLDA